MKSFLLLAVIFWPLFICCYFGLCLFAGLLLEEPRLLRKCIFLWQPFVMHIVHKRVIKSSKSTSWTCLVNTQHRVFCVSDLVRKSKMVSVESEKSELGLDKSRGVFSRRSVSDHWKFGVGSQFFKEILKRRQENTQGIVWHHIIELFFAQPLVFFLGLFFLVRILGFFAFCSCCNKSDLGI